MKQQCYLAMIYVSWAVYAGGAAYFACTGRYVYLALWVVLAPVFQIAYVRIFPRISQAMGYGKITDESPAAVAEAKVHVTLYTAFGCPFCRLVQERLQTLQRNMHFTLNKVDVTFRPDLLAAKAIRAVPVVEIGDQKLVGNVTSEQLAQALTGDDRALTANA